MAGPADASLLSAHSWSLRGDSRERERYVFGEAKRHDVQLLLAAGVPQQRLAGLTGVSVRTIQRIGPKPAGHGGRAVPAHRCGDIAAGAAAEEPGGVAASARARLRRRQVRGLHAGQATAHASHAFLPDRGPAVAGGL